MADTYKETRVITFPGMVARIYIPDLTAEERERRMKSIKRAAAQLLKNNIRRKEKWQRENF